MNKLGWIMKKLVCALIAIYILIVPMVVSANNTPLDRKVIVIDAGHGGYDSGMTIGKVKEKDINLSIALKLQTLLVQDGATVIMTRADDSGLAKNKYRDMNVRWAKANASEADIFVSIHQNAHQSSNAKGAIVFFFSESDNGQKLAICVQNRIKEFVDNNNKFAPEANSKYFVLRKTKMPSVLVECGFLTNYAERQKLLTEEYQEKIARGIYLGIIDYFNQTQNTDTNTPS